MSKFKLLICGGRHFDNYTLLQYIVDSYLADKSIDYDNLEIVSGHCEGADLLGEEFAFDHDVDMKVFPADWKSFGRSAGPIRNRQMVDYIKSSTAGVIAFVSPNSKGTKNTISYAQKCGVDVVEIPYEVFESSCELYEGVTRNEDGTYNIDWDENDKSDIVSFSANCSKYATINGQKVFYGYKVNKKSENKKDRIDFLRWIKENPNWAETLIAKMINDFHNKTLNENISFDYIIKTASSSKINELIIDALKADGFDKCEVLTCSKLPLSALGIDYKKFQTENPGKEIPKDLADNIRKVKNRKSGEFSAKSIIAKYRKYICPMITLDNTEIKLDAKILIVDDIITTGSTVATIVNQLDKLGFKGTITVLSLINNK